MGTLIANQVHTSMGSVNDEDTSFYQVLGVANARRPETKTSGSRYIALVQISMASF